VSGASASSSPQDGVRLASVLSNAFIESVKSLRRDANRELMIDFEFFIMERCINKLLLFCFVNFHVEKEKTFLVPAKSERALHRIETQSIPPSCILLGTGSRLQYKAFISLDASSQATLT